jgi:hypothetical protein
VNLHRFTQYIKYKWKAKGRHGVHSPFVYKFIEDGLQKIRAVSLRELLAIYFGEDILIFAGEDAAAWQQLIHAYAETNNVIAIKNIHHAAQRTEHWQQLIKDRRVTLSIDLFEYGLVFFNKEFKEKQHFVLKYPA